MGESGGLAVGQDYLVRENDLDEGEGSERVLRLETELILHAACAYEGTARGDLSPSQGARLCVEEDASVDAFDGESIGIADPYGEAASRPGIARHLERVEVEVQVDQGLQVVLVEGADCDAAFVSGEGEGRAGLNSAGAGDGGEGVDTQLGRNGEGESGARREGVGVAQLERERGLRVELGGDGCELEVGGSDGGRGGGLVGEGGEEVDLLGSCIGGLNSDTCNSSHTRRHSDIQHSEPQSPTQSPTSIRALLYLQHITGTPTCEQTRQSLCSETTEWQALNKAWRGRH